MRAPGRGAPAPLDTAYRNILFRSRLEARWAVCFDALDIEWEYEPSGWFNPDDPYLPDFWFPHNRMYGEVKPRHFDDMELRRCNDLARGSGHPVLLLAGMPEMCGYPAMGGAPIPLYVSFDELLDHEDEWNRSDDYYEARPFSVYRLGLSRFVSDDSDPYQQSALVMDERNSAITAARAARFDPPTGTERRRTWHWTGCQSGRRR